MTTTNSELRQQILDCFKRTKMQQDGDTELFDTDLTIDLIQALIDRKCNEARINELENCDGDLEASIECRRGNSYLTQQERLAELQASLKDGENQLGEKS